MSRIIRLVAMVAIATAFAGRQSTVRAVTPPTAFPYQIVDLGSLGGSSANALDVNAVGQVVGYARRLSDNLPAAFLYQNGSMTDIGENFSAVANGVNAAGQIVGDAFTANGIRAFHYDAGQFTVLGTFGGRNSSAQAINDGGDIVGYSQDSDFSTFAFLHRLGGMTNLGALGGSNSYAYGVNNFGVVVGEAMVAGDTVSHAFVYQNGVMQDLTPTSNADQTYAFDINDVGQIVGGGQNTSGGNFLFLYENGVFTDLGTLGGTHANVYDINNFGRIVGGSSTAPGGELHAFLYQDDTMADLNDMIDPSAGWTILMEAYAINDAGQIVGVGIKDGQERAFLMTPVGSTAPGTNVIVSPTVELPGGGTTAVSITFGIVQQGGETTVMASTTGPAVPSGFNLSDPPLYFDVTTTASFSGAVTLCFPWAEGSIQNEANVKLLHYENAAWADVTTSVNTQTNIVCGSVSSLSPFVITELGFEFLGFRTPLLADGSASIQQSKAGRTIPVKFQLRFSGQLTGVATATIAVYRILNTATGTIDTTDLTGDAGAANENSDRFRYDAADQQYIYNLQTKGWAAPATYRAFVTLSDGSVHSVDFSLR